MLRSLLVFFLCLSSVALARQDPEQLRSVVENFIRAQNAGAETSVTVERVDPNLNLANCPSPEAFLPPGARALGNTTIGVRCPGSWTVFIPAKVKVMSDILVSARPLSAGTVIGYPDVMLRKTDLASTFPGTLTNVEAALGKSLASSLPAGYPIRAEMLRAPIVIRQGQSVRLISKGAGFSVSAEAVAIGPAAEGQSVQVKTASGQIVTGIVRAGPVVEVSY